MVATDSNRRADDPAADGPPARPFTVEDLYQPYWIEGRMQVKNISSELADAGYQMDAEKIYAYELE